MPKHRCTQGELEDQNLVAPVFSPSDITCPKFFSFILFSKESFSNDFVSRSTLTGSISRTQNCARGAQRFPSFFPFSTALGFSAMEIDSVPGEVSSPSKLGESGVVGGFCLDHGPSDAARQAMQEIERMLDWSLADEPVPDDEVLLFFCFF